MEPTITLPTRLYTDSVEWCSQRSFADIFAYGLYELKEQTRMGGIVLGRFHDSEKSVEILQEFDVPGVLDLRWANIDRFSSSPFLSSALADGTIHIHELKRKESNETEVELVPHTELRIDDILCLSLEWNNSIQSDIDPQIVVSRSDGCISIVGFAELSQLEVIETWKAHEYEAWVASFHLHDPCMILTGADDCLLKGWDARSTKTRPTFVSKRHEMGVCSIMSHPTECNVIATGSYDEHLRLWDVRNFKVPMIEQKLSGGVWRIKWNPCDPLQMLVATMQDGFKVVTFKDSTFQHEGAVVQHMQKQASLAYGVGYRSCGSWVAGCSFYDRAFHLWQPPKETVPM